MRRRFESPDNVVRRPTRDRSLRHRLRGIGLIAVVCCLLTGAGLLATARARIDPAEAAVHPLGVHSGSLVAPTEDVLPPTGGLSRELVHGTDDRFRAYPDWVSHRHMVYLEIWEADGPAGHCSGTIVGKRAILTAAHCAVSDAGEPPVTSVRVVPGKDGEAEPWGSQFASGYSLPNGWVTTTNEVERRRYDFALLFMPNDQLTSLTGAFPGPLTALSDSALNAASFMPLIIGYPGDCLSATCWQDSAAGIGPPFGTYLWVSGAAEFVLVEDYFLYETSDVWQGQSGSGVFRNADGAIVGVFTNTGPNANLSVRLTTTVVGALLQYCASEAGCQLNVDPQSVINTPTSTPTPTKTPTATPTKTPTLVSTPTVTPTPGPRPYRSTLGAVARD